MARTGSGTGSGTLLCRRNIKLDSFLKRNTERAVYERIRTYEPCVVISETINKVYMHVVLSDERVYLTEYPPRALTIAFSFRRVRDIELVNDLPDFLSGKDRELCQHIRITYLTEKPAAKGRDWLRRTRGRGFLLQLNVSFKMTILILSSWKRICSVCIRVQGEGGTEEVHMLPPTRSASWPNPESLGLLKVPHPPARPPSKPPSLYSLSSSPSISPSPSDQRLNIGESAQVPRRMGSVLSRLLRRDGGSSREERQAELHLYAVSRTSRLYLHLQSSWNSYIIRSTLSLDPLYRRRCSVLSDSTPDKRLPSISLERTAHLFGQLSAELLQEEISVESLYLLLQELRTAAHRNVALRRLFWRVRRSNHALSTLIVQTLAVMFRETEVEAARHILLSAKKGALASRMLLALICDPELVISSLCLHRPDGRLTPPLVGQKGLWIESEILDAACEFTTLCNFSNCVSIGWILRVIQPHPHLLDFLSYQAQHVVLVLSDLQESCLSPAQCVLLFQRCRLLLACLQYNSQLAQHLRSHFREEFRYSVKLSCAEEKLPLQYPISQPTLRLIIIQKVFTLCCVS
uniref:Si:ch211-258f14.2 n=1 Tax=Labrus bergylta TaxID=56723 RepID=A0A3Q3EF87_9LABR